MKRPLVSVIVPTRNSAKFLGKCLDSIAKQSYSNIELIIVDNNSRDNTKEIARQFTSKVYNKGPERSKQMNFGASKAKGKYLYRVDSDFYVQSNVVNECVWQCEERGFDCIAVHNTSDPTVSFWSKVRKFERDMYKGDELIVGARFWSKKAFDAVDGFNEKMIACEDYDIHNRMLDRGFHIGRIKSVDIHLGEPKTLGEIMCKSYDYGVTMQKVKLNKRLREQLSPIRESFLTNLDKFLLHPVLAFGFFVMNFFKYVSFKLGSMQKETKSAIKK